MQAGSLQTPRNGEDGNGEWAFEEGKMRAGAARLTNRADNSSLPDNSSQACDVEPHQRNPCKALMPQMHGWSACQLLRSAGLMPRRCASLHASQTHRAWMHAYPQTCRVICLKKAVHRCALHAIFGACKSAPGNAAVQHQLAARMRKATGPDLPATAGVLGQSCTQQALLRARTRWLHCALSAIHICISHYRVLAPMVSVA